MYKNKIILALSFFSFFFVQVSHAVEEEASEYEIPYPKENRQNIISTNSYQEYNSHIGLYFEQGVVLSQFSDKFIPILSSKSGINLNNTFQFYAGGYYLVNNPEINYEINGRSENVKIYNFSSLRVGASYTPFGVYFVHPKFSLEYARSTLLLTNNNVNYQINYDSLSPGIIVDMNVWKYFNMGFGIQYRYIFNNEKIVANNNFEYIFQISIGNL